MRITIAQLEAFYWTAQLGSVQKAAQHLNLAQPTVSLRLRDLREAIGIDVFERTGRGLRANAEGRSLLQKVTAIFTEVEKIRGRGGDTEVAGPIRLGLAEGFAVICLPLLIDALGRDFPALRPELAIATSAGLEPDLVADRLDLAVLVNPIGHESLRFIPLGIQPTRWVAPTSWNIGQGVRPSDFWNMPIITNPPPSAMYRQIVGWFASAGLEPARLSLCSSVAVTAQLVASGIAVGVLPEKMVEPYVSSGAMTVLRSDPPMEDGKVFAAYRKGLTSAAVDGVLRTLVRVLAGMDYLRKMT